MSISLVDSSVLLDVYSNDSTWREWSERAIEDSVQGGGIAINPLIYAEIAPGFASGGELDDALPRSLLRLHLPWAAAFLASRAFLEYRRGGGTRTSPLPDFYIGAHAQVEGFRLVTRDARRYRTYFPDLDIFAP